MSAVALQTFGFGEQLIRTVDMGGEPWFVAKDVCSALEIGNVSAACEKLDADEVKGVSLTERGISLTDRGISSIDGRGSSGSIAMQTIMIVSESGMYTLVLRCRDATKAGTRPHQFKRWVTSEVLPQIRRTGRYVAAPDGDVESEDAVSIVGEAPDEVELIRTRLLLVREARFAFGPMGARRAWELAGLPDVRTAGSGSVLAVAARLHGPVLDWIVERCNLVTGARATPSALHADFDEWCRSNDRESLSLIGFGKALTAAGVGAGKDAQGLRFRIGIALKD